MKGVCFVPRFEGPSQGPACVTVVLSGRVLRGAVWLHSKNECVWGFEDFTWWGPAVCVCVCVRVFLPLPFILWMGPMCVYPCVCIMHVEATVNMNVFLNPFQLFSFCIYLLSMYTETLSLAKMIDHCPWDPLSPLPNSEINRPSYDVQNFMWVLETRSSMLTQKVLIDWTISFQHPRLREKHVSHVHTVALSETASNSAQACSLQDDCICSQFSQIQKTVSFCLNNFGSFNGPFLHLSTPFEDCFLWRSH